MRQRTRQYLPVLITAVTVSALTAGGPALAAAAYDAVNADKVDGRHAVGAGASSTNRAGKLVATNAAGKLPDNIIAKAPDASKLGGVGPAGYLRTLPGAVTGEEVLDGSLQRGDLSYDATVPRAFGLVLHTGSLEATKPSSGLTSDNVTSPPDTQGIYCISGLGFTPTTVSVSSSLWYSGPVTVHSYLGQGAGCEEVEGTQITVWTYAIQNASAYDGSFNIQIWGF